MELKKAAYTITEAAERLVSTPRQIIEAVIERKLKLYVRMPERLDLYNAGCNEVYLNRLWAHTEFHEKPKPFRQSDIDFLVVSDVVLTQLEKGHSSMEAIFSLGGRIGKSGDIEIVEPKALAYWPGILSAHISPDAVHRCFATYRPGTDIDAPGVIRHPQRFEISIDDLMLDRPSLRLLTGTIEKARPLGFPELNAQGYTGPNLRGLYSLFCRIWGYWGSNEFVEPTARLVSDALTSEFKFSANVAELGVRVIVKDVLPDRDNRTGAPRIVARMMNDLISGSICKWKPEPAQALPNPTNAEVMQWFVERGWSNSAAKVAAVIIRPSYAPKGRNTG